MPAAGFGFLHRQCYAHQSLVQHADGSFVHTERRDAWVSAPGASAAEMELQASIEAVRQDILVLRCELDRAEQLVAGLTRRGAPPTMAPLDCG